MRVGYLTYGLDRAPTGIGRYAVDLLCALATLPDAPTLVLLSTEASDPQGLWSQFEHYPLPGCRRLPALLSVGNVALSQAIRRYQLDIVHDPNGIAPFLGPAMGARRIVTLHDAFAFVCPEMHNWLDNWRYRSMLPTALRCSDAVISVSEASRRDLLHTLGLAPTQVHVIAEGVAPCFQPVAPECSQPVLERYGITRPYILYLGALNARKNIARLLEAFAQVHLRHPQFTLVLGGKPQWKTASISTTLRQLDLGDAVQFIGYVADADLPALYSAATLFVFPSLYEGFGLPPLEAMACGTPVIAANATALPEVLGSAALLVDPYDVAAISAAMDRALSDPKLRADLRRRGFERVSYFTWQRTASATYALYQQVCSAAHTQHVPKG